MIASTPITNTEVFAFIAVLVFKLSSRKVLFVNRKDKLSSRKVFFINRKDNRAVKRVGCFLGN